MPRPSLASLRDQRYFTEIGLLQLINVSLIVVLRICIPGHPEVTPDAALAISTSLPGAQEATTEYSSSPANRSSHDQ